MAMRGAWRGEARTLRMPSRMAMERRPGWTMAMVRPTRIAIGSARSVPWKPRSLRMCEKKKV